MMDESPILFIFLASHQQSVYRPLSLQGCVQLVTHNLVAVGIGDNAEVAEAHRKPQIGYITHPELSSPCQYHVPDQVRVLFVPMVGIGCIGLSAAIAYQQPVFTKQRIEQVPAHLDAMGLKAATQHEV